MKVRFTAIVICIAAVLTQPYSVKAEGASIIPAPVKVELTEGVFTLTPDTVIIVTAETDSVGQYLAQLLSSATGFDLKVRQSSPAENRANRIFLLDISHKKQLGPEGYELKVMKNSIFANASTPAGLFYACQTLRQLLPAAIEDKEKVAAVNWIIPQIEIEDKPRYVWRGMHLDESRHFFGKELVKKYIDLLALYKMNIFHWHLTGNEGWRIEIKKYPKLTSIGAWRTEPAGKYGGYYTQKDIREIVKYAKDRFITIVPEIGMPGYSQSAFAAYPELSCSGGPFKVGLVDEKPTGMFCAGNEKTLGFIDDILSEVVDMFDGKYIHIGGGKYQTRLWANCEKCKSMMQSKGIKNTGELYNYFIERVSELLTAKNKRLIGRIPILESNVPQNAIVILRGQPKDTIKVVRKGHDVVLCSAEHAWLNYKIPNSPEKAGHPRGNITLKRVYSYQPTPDELTAEEARHVLGPHIKFWTEYVANGKELEYLLFPRMCALAEVAWSPEETRQWSSFRKRLEIHSARLDKLGVNFCRDRALWDDNSGDKKEER